MKFIFDLMFLDKFNFIGGFVIFFMKLLDSFGCIFVSFIYDYNLMFCFVGFQFYYYIEEGELREIQFFLDLVLEKVVILQIEERVNIYISIYVFKCSFNFWKYIVQKIMQGGLSMVV